MTPAVGPHISQPGVAGTKVVRRPKTRCLPPLIGNLYAAGLENICFNSAACKKPPTSNPLKNTDAADSDASLTP